MVDLKCEIWRHRTSGQVWIVELVSLPPDHSLRMLDPQWSRLRSVQHA
jgi:hypothetical protein